MGVLEEWHMSYVWCMCIFNISFIIISFIISSWYENNEGDLSLLSAWDNCCMLLLFCFCLVLFCRQYCGSCLLLSKCILYIMRNLNKIWNKKNVENRHTSSSYYFLAIPCYRWETDGLYKQNNLTNRHETTCNKLYPHNLIKTKACLSYSMVVLV